MKCKFAFALIFLFLGSTYLPIISIAHAQPTDYTSTIPIQATNAAIIIGQGTSDPTPLLQTKRILDNKGILYEIIPDTNLQTLNTIHFGLIIVLGQTEPRLENSEKILIQMIENGTGIIWISSNLPKFLFSVAGLNLQDDHTLSGITAIQYGQTTTKVYDETLNLVKPQGASIHGYFLDQQNRQIAPAEISFRQKDYGLVYYFAYDVCSWWSADPDMPWLRAYRLEMAINTVLSDHFTVSLAPYPRNFKAVFITRIEDVDPLHTSAEWLTRANSFLNDYASRDFPLTVALTPRYIDPEMNLDVGLEEVSANSLRTWLSAVILRGGTIIEHGYTHQYSKSKTGIGPEFFNEDLNQWLPLEEQKQRIQNGFDAIEESLGYSPRGFEAPHYIANNSTYQALHDLGFTYTTHNSDTPFLDSYGYAGLVNIPETLGYLPLNADNQVESNMKSQMDMLYNMSAVMLYFNHLFDDSATKVGSGLIEHATAKTNLWITNTNNLADFYIQRLNALGKMNVSTTADELIVDLGSCSRAGLTLTLNNAHEIKAVKVNDQEWSTFDSDCIILPPLTSSSNTITISFYETHGNNNISAGYIALCVSVASAFVVVFQTAGVKKINPLKQLWRRTK